MEAKDWEPSNSHYDPDITHDLGILSATEMGHNYGEYDHPQTRECLEWTPYGCAEWGTYNVMAGEQAMPTRGFWFTSESERDIQDYAWNHL